jgi:predicted transposase/invertase (TIGR01784 family)
MRRRSRYYQSLIDSSLLEPGETDFGKLNDVYVIFIAPFDLFGEKKYCYTFVNTCIEDNDIKLDDGVVKIFLNTRGKNDDEVSKDLVELLHAMEIPFKEGDNIETENEKVRKLADYIRKLKKFASLLVRILTQTLKRRNLLQNRQVKLLRNVRS